MRKHDRNVELNGMVTTYVVGGSYTKGLGLANTDFFWGEYFAACNLSKPLIMVGLLMLLQM